MSPYLKYPELSTHDQEQADEYLMHDKLYETHTKNCALTPLILPSSTHKSGIQNPKSSLQTYLDSTSVCVCFLRAFRESQYKL